MSRHVQTENANEYVTTYEAVQQYGVQCREPTQQAGAERLRVIIFVRWKSHLGESDLNPLTGTSDY